MDKRGKLKFAALLPLVLSLMLILIAIFTIFTNHNLTKTTGKSIFDFIKTSSISSTGLLATPQNENCLCVYNNNSAISKEICEYYVLKRSGVSILGLDIPNSAFSDEGNETMTYNNFYNYVKQPVLSWVASHPGLKITHLAVAKNIPINVDGKSGYWYLALRDVNDSFAIGNEFYGKIEHFNPDGYNNLRFVVSYLTGYTLDDVKKMIDKATSPADDYNSLNWVVDKHVTGASIRNNNGEPIYLIRGSEYTFNNTDYFINWNYGLEYLNFPSLDSFTVYPLDLNIKIESGILQKKYISGQNYFFNISLPLPTANALVRGSVYTNNGQNFIVLKNTSHIYGQYECSLPAYKDGCYWGFNSPSGIPPEESGVLTKVSGEGINSINFFSAYPVTNEINFTYIGDPNELLAIEGTLEETERVLLDSNVNQTSIVLERTDTKPFSANNVIAYYGTGSYHPNYGGACWVTNPNNFIFDVSNRAIMTSAESFNAITFTGAPCPYRPAQMNFQGLIADAITENAFNGVNYSNSFSGAIGHVNEPYLIGVAEPYHWMTAYANGMTLAESAMSAWFAFWTNPAYDKANSLRGIVIGDPLMTATDEIKLGLGMQCTQDTDCMTGNCDADKNRIKRCHINPTSCVNGPVGWEGNVNSVFPFGKFETPTGSSYCFDSTHSRQCMNSAWQEPVSCSSGKSCKEIFGSLGEEYSIGEASCKLDNGQQCASNDECYSGNCDMDLIGVKRCHHNSRSCVVNETGDEKNNYEYLCISPTTKRQCVNNVWQESVSCAGNCDCTETEFGFNIKSGKSYYLTLPVNTSSKFIKDLFLEPPLGLIISLWKNDSWISINFGEDDDGNAVWSSNEEINLGRGFILNSPDDYIFTIKGTPINTPVSANIVGRSSLIGIPYCYQNYNVSKTIGEINSFDKSCLTIVRWNNTEDKYEAWSLNSSFDYSTFIKKDFDITNYESYWILCNSSTNFLWQPECPICERDSNCDDNNSSTKDICINPGTSSSYCLNDIVKCFNDSDCGSNDYFGNTFCMDKNVDMNFISFTCNNSATSLSYCSNKTTIKILEICDDYCLEGICKNFVCHNDSDCNDNNHLTEDTCLNANTINSSCINKPIKCFVDSDCGSNGIIDDLFCIENNVTGNYISFNCVNKGKSTSYCTNYTFTQNIQKCSDYCLNGECKSFICKTDADCDDNNDITEDICNNASASSSSCLNIFNISKMTVFNISVLNISQSDDGLFLKKDNSNIIFISNLTDISEIKDIQIILSNSSDNFGYIIVKNVSLNSNQTKTLYFSKKNDSSNAVCFVDDEIISNVVDIHSCTKLQCPGSFGTYSCAIEGDYFVVFGLVHSVVIEDRLYCGDKICYSDESCSSCATDCGNCPSSPGPGGSGGGGGGSGGSPRSTNTTNRTQNLTNENFNTTIQKNESEKGTLNIGTELSSFFENNAFKYSIYVFAFIIFVVIIFIIFFFVKKRNKNEIDEPMKKLKIGAKKIIEEARKRGCDENEIRKMFTEKGWKDDDINYLLKS